MNLVNPIYQRSFERRGDEKMLRLYKAVQWQADHFEEIPVVVVACLKGVIAPWPSIATSSAYGSIFPAVQNLLLAARAAGLGTALITAPLWSTLLAGRALGLPWNITPCAVIPLGWPIGQYGPHDASSGRRARLAVPIRQSSVSIGRRIPAACVRREWLRRKRWIIRFPTFR
jgi:hypothetical protein